MPRPAVSAKSFGSASGTPASSANCASALAVGWLLYFSAEAATRSSSAGAVVAERREPAHRQLAGRERAGLVEHKGVDAARPVRCPRRS